MDATDDDCRAAGRGREGISAAREADIMTIESAGGLIEGRSCPGEVWTVQCPQNGASLGTELSPRWTGDV